MLNPALQGSQFEAFIHKHSIVFVDFWAEWCEPCKVFAKVYEAIAQEYPDIQFAKVNIEDELELSDNLQIRSIPHLMIFKEGILIYSEAGAMPQSILKDLVKQAIAVDVSEIKEKIDKGEL